MFDITRQVQLATGDLLRRSAMRIVAGVIVAAGAGFLLAALWSSLAYGLGWGATYASLSIGVVLGVIGSIVFVIAAKPRHVAPTSEDLKREVEAQVNLVADIATERVNRFASDTAQKVGLTRQNLGIAQDLARTASIKASQAASSNRGSMAKLAGAFVIGTIIAMKLRGGRNQHDDSEM